ncbi:MAG: hypothetical protein JZU65_19940 [Chlorobium sp.]|nr:hypothetical protein [Chlorobium sp.]
MKKNNLVTILLLLCFSQTAWSDDTDIYSISNINVKPNVLVIFDNSGSMSTNDVPGEKYDPNKDYSYAGGKDRNAVILRADGSTYFSDIYNSNWQCNEAKTKLLTTGTYSGKIKKDKTTGVVSCGGKKDRDLRLGNYQNFDAQDLGDKKTRMEVAKDVIAQLINDNFDKVRFGLMKFNNDEGGYIVAGCGATKSDLIGNFNPTTTVFTDTDQSANFGAIGGMKSDTWTPLAETMAEAGRYFAGTKSWFNGTSTGAGYPYGKYSLSCASSNTSCYDYINNTPIQYRCQKNYIIFMTDGEPTQDDNAKLKNSVYINGIKIPAANKDGAADYIDDVAYFLAHNDLQPVGANPSTDDVLKKGQTGDFEFQTVTTYTIGFQQNLSLLQDAATNGGGVYYTADNASTLNEALNNIITAISNNNEGFSAAAVPVSRANKAYAGNFVYYGLFQPNNIGNWTGNLKKYGITDSGLITDKNGVAAVNGGAIINNAQSYWSSTIDGPSVIKGGAGEKLYDDLDNGFTRKIYTYTGTKNELTDSTNVFNSSNTALPPFNTNLSTSVISGIRHDNDSEWPLASFLHSQPLVVHYDDNNDGSDDHSMIFAGANDGMLHCFDDNDGSEKWGFIPQDLLTEIHTLPTATSLQYYVDGSPSLYTYDHDNNSSTQEKKILIFGERRGGTNYTALDISNYDSPLIKYEIKADILGGGSKVLGQSWAKPEASKVGYMDGSTYKTKDVFIMAGGYDNNQDSTTPATTDDEGRAVYGIDSQTGSLQTNLNFNIENFSSMTHSIVAISPFENPKSRTTTRIYAGDMNGNLFAFRDDIFHRNQDKDKKGAFEDRYDGEEDGIWGQKLKLFSSPGKKIFYAPNILNVVFPVQFTYPAAETKESNDVVVTEMRIGDYIFYGTGDREHPEDTTVLNEFYAIKNNWQWNDSTAPTLVKAYVDSADGKIKAKSDNQVIVSRDSNGKLTAAADSQLFIIDVTDDLYQNGDTDTDKQKLYKNYAIEAVNHPSNRGWYIRFVEKDGTQAGEKIVSTPIIYGGVLYFTTYVPEPASTNVANDPCTNPGAKGSGYIYAIGVRYGEAVINFYLDPTDKEAVNRHDRRNKLQGKGIPPEPVLVIHEGKPTIITGFETIDPVFEQSLEPFFWRQLYN